MIDEPRINVHGHLKIGEYEPGNGIRYTAVATLWAAGPVSMGVLGVVSDGWLVVSGNSGKAYLFQHGGYLIDSYIQENLGGSPDDFPYFGDLVRLMVGTPLPRTIKTTVSDDMPDDREGYYNERAERMP